MANRETLYDQFGPKMFEAMLQVILDENNILRVALGLPERTMAQASDKLESKLDNIPDYDFLKEQP
jgi:hypothetical protein